MRTVAIVGAGPLTRDLARQEPASTECWGLNKAHGWMHRWDRWFQLHPRTWRGDATMNYGRGPEHVAFLSTCGVPVYQTKLDERIPTSVAFPASDVVADIGRDYLTSTIALAIALAIHENVGEIKLFGIDMVGRLEYMSQRPCIEWLLGMAEGRGIKVTVPERSPLLAGPRYATSEMNESEAIQRRILDKKGEFVRFRDSIMAAFGALREAQRNEDLPRIAHLEAVIGRAMPEVYRVQGALDEIIRSLQEKGVPDLVSPLLPTLAPPADITEVVEIREPVETPA